MIHYRVATQADYQAIAALHAKSWQLHYRGIFSDHYLDKEIIEERLNIWRERFNNPSDNQYIILAEERGEVCGFAGAYLNHHAEWGALLDNLHVLPKWQGTGMGKKLMQESAKWIHQQDPEAYMYLWVLEQNTSAKGFYTYLGAEIVEKSTSTNPDGTKSPILCCLWKDLAKFISSEE